MNTFKRHVGPRTLPLCLLVVLSNISIASSTCENKANNSLAPGHTASHSMGCHCPALALEYRGQTDGKGGKEGGGSIRGLTGDKGDKEKQDGSLEKRHEMRMIRWMERRRVEMNYNKSNNEWPLFIKYHS